MIEVNTFTTQKGATVLEVMLGLAIASAFLVLGIKLFSTVQMSYQVAQLQNNVDQLFDAASSYYMANCAAGDFAPNPQNMNSPYTVTAGLVYPPAANAYFPVSVPNNLITVGYLTNWVPLSPLVDASGGDSGYVVQLNPVISSAAIPANACVVIKPGTACVRSTPQMTIPTTQAVIVTWNIQVAVKMKNPSQIKATAAIMNADCISGEKAGSSPTTVDVCPSANAAKNYLVWQRTPSYASIAKGQSVFVGSMPQLIQINNLYTHDKNYEMGSGYSTTTTPPQAPVYYVCGG